MVVRIGAVLAAVFATAAVSATATAVLGQAPASVSCRVDTLTAGFGAEIAAAVAREAFWQLDAPVDRLCVDDVPMPYHQVLLEAVLPSAESIAERIEQLLRA